MHAHLSPGVDIFGEANLRLKSLFPCLFPRTPSCHLLLQQNLRSQLEALTPTQLSTTSRLPRLPICSSLTTSPSANEHHVPTSLLQGFLDVLSLLHTTALVLAQGPPGHRKNFSVSLRAFTATSKLSPPDQSQSVFCTSAVTIDSQSWTLTFPSPSIVFFFFRSFFRYRLVSLSMDVH